MTWQCVFEDGCTGDWHEQWTLDGETAEVANTPEGMILRTRPEPEAANFAVLWTKQEFRGDLRIEYDFTRLDSTTLGVNIIYIEATGMGKEPYAADISKWAELRRLPLMSHYFNFMNTYHISYAAYDFRKPDCPDYIRARRYMPKGDIPDGLAGTALLPDDYGDTGFFKTGIPCRLTAEKTNGKLTFSVESEEREESYVWDTTSFPPIEEGRIGLRLMTNRASRFANFKVHQRK